ncbi:MAG: Cna B-type domain-containing protein [Peptostreptococcus sp.]|uniref:SpaA isopeptide-forming pilin-related protein n=1 Tax=Peptostreptococcus sp. TaxID=1262 RepID=UPI001CB4054B|nr:SpaA isopeptide-forming pilin-related protein [Peptostreptococcus sp.]MBF1044913.1 Cna B-type domain-containing protein [Peptostreptococcus sp.]
MLRDFLKKTITILLVVMMITQYLPHSASGEGLSGSDISQGGISSIWHDLFGFGDAESKSAESKSTESKSTESNDVEVDTNEKANSNNDSVETEDKNEPADQIEIGEPTDTVVSVSEKDESLTPLYQNLIIDVSDNLGGKVNAVEFKLTQTSPKSNEANVRTGKTIRGKLVFNGLEKGEYLLETSKNLTGFDQTRLKYKVTVSDDARISVTDLLNNREASTTTGKESIVNNNLILSLEAKKTSGNIISIPISIQALKRDKLTRLSLYADLNEAFADQTYNISAGEGTYNSGKYKFTDISFDSSNKWTANIKLKIKDGKLDKADVKKIFENIYLDNDGKKVNITSPLLYMSEVVENTKLNVDLIRKEEPEVKPYKKTELPISPRSLTASEMSKSVDLDATDELPPVMLDSIIEATVNNALAASNGSELSDSDIRLLARTASLPGENGKGKVVINKVDKASNAPLEDAVFELLSSDKQTVVQTKTSGTDGKVRFDNINQGTYYIREATAPPGYAKDDTVWKVEVDSQGNTQVYNIGKRVQSDEVAKFAGSAQNRNVYAKSKVVDVNYDKGTFTVVSYLNIDGKSYYHNNKSYSPMLYIYPSRGVSSAFNTRYTNLTFEYSVVKASTLPDEVQDYEVLPTSLYYGVVAPVRTNDNYFTVNFMDAFKNPGYAAIVKTTMTFDKNANRSLWTGTWFDARTPNGILYSTNHIDLEVKKNKPAIDAYVPIKSSDPSVFTFKAENSKAYDVVGRIQIDKTDKTGNNLTGAGFTLTNSNNPSKVYNVTTSAGQTAFIDDIPPGTYTLRESVTPTGYVPSNEVWDVTVDKRGNSSITKRGTDPNSTVSSVAYNGNNANMRTLNPSVGALRVVNVKSKIKIKKVEFASRTTPIDGAEFELYKESGAGKVTTGKKATTDASGLLEFEISEVNKVYWLKETRVPEGYKIETEANGAEKYYGPFAVDSSGAVKTSLSAGAQAVQQPFEITNKKINEKNALTIKKVDSKSTNITLDGAVFELYEEAGGNKVSTTKKGTSNASGVAEFEGLEASKVYWVREVTSPDGYTKEKASDGSDKYYGPFVINARGIIRNGQEATAQKVDQPYIVTNKKVNEKNKLLLKKVADDASKTPLEDAVFELYKDNGGNKVSTGIKTSSSSDGTFEFEALETGKLYWLKEVTAPIGYEKEKDASGDKYYGPFAIDNKGIARIGLGTDAQKADQPFEIKNKKTDSRKSKFIIEKQDSKGNPLAGAEFKIYSADDNWTNLQELSATNYKLELNPAKNTFTFSDLKKGKYVVKESKAPNGYIVSTEVLKVEVMEDSQTKIVNAENFNRRVRRSVDGFESNSVSMGDPSRGSSGFFSLAARGISRFMSAGTSEVSPATRNTLGAARAPGSTRDPAISQLGLEQLYTEKPEPTAYTTDGEGEYPSPLVQSDPTVRNSNIPLDGLHWYESLYSRPNSGKPATNLQVAGVNKYAREAKDNGNTIEGEYDINLKTQGNLVNPDEYVDIVLVYDNSLSMSDRAASDQNRERFDVAKEKTEAFVDTLLSNENNPNGRIRMSLVTYAADIYDGEWHTSTFDDARAKLRDYTYEDFTVNPNIIKNYLPRVSPAVDTPITYDTSHPGTWPGTTKSFGGTFTSGAMKKAQEILDTKSSPSHKKVIIHVTDGMPTRSLKIQSVNADGTVNFVNGVTKGDGSDYILPDKYYKYINVTFNPGFLPFPVFTYVGTQSEVSNKWWELMAHKNNGTSVPIIHNNKRYMATVHNLEGVYSGDLGTYETTHASYNAGSTNIRDHGYAAKGIAKNLIKEGVEIYNIGVELGDPSITHPKYLAVSRPKFIDKSTAIELMKGMSSDEGKGHYYDVERVDQLENVFKDLLRKLPQRTVYMAETTDPMGDMVDLKLPAAFKSKNWSGRGLVEDDKNPGYYIIYDGSKTGASFPAGFEFNLTASDESLKKEVRVLYNPDTRTIKMNNYTLGKDEWINLAYKVNLRTTDPNYEDNRYYPTNGITELQPNTYFDRKWRYPVPSVKGPMNSINVEKKWQDVDGNAITGTPIRVKLQRRARHKINNAVIIDWTDAKKTGTNDVMSLQLDSSSDWKGSFKNLLKYDTQYTYEYRVVEENVPEGFTSSIELTDANGNVVNNDDGVKNGAGYAKITNTKSKRKIKVKKTWKTDENTDGKSVTVHLKAFKGDTNTPLKVSDLLASELNAIRISGSTSPVSISGQDVVITTSLSKANNWEAVFENLPIKTKETASSKAEPIVYRVEEDQVDGYEVDYNYNDGTLGLVNYKVPKLGFKNEKNKIEFIKTDEKGNEIAEADLAVAKFVLKRTDEPGSAPINATRQGSKFIFEGLSPGTYELWEEVAPNNYDKPNTALTKFVVDQDGRIGTPVALHVINSSTTAPEDKYLKEDNGYKIKNYKKDMKFKFEKVAPIGPNSVTVLANGELKLELYKATSTSDESQKIDGVFANSYDLSQQRPETPFVVPITKDKVPSGIYYIKETQAPAGYAIGSDKIYIEVDWDNRTIKQVENPFDPANKRDVGQALYTEVNNSAGECLNILRIVNNRIELPRSGGIGPHVISLAGIGIMLAATFIYRRRVY